MADGWTRTALTRRLGLRWPIVQAPMAGGPTTPELVAAVCNAGALGSFAAALLPPDEIRKSVAEIRRLTDRPFAVNLFALEPPAADAAAIERVHAVLQPYRDELGLGEPPALPNKLMENCREQAEALLAEKVPVFSFTFGLPDRDLLRRFKTAGTVIVGTATTVAEARALAEAGCDAVCAQGFEAGGHRGTFLGGFEESLVGTLALVPQMADAVDVPVIAAGGIMDGRGIAAALALGAAGAQLGTAFLRCPEAGTPPMHRAALAELGDDGTALTRVFTGRPARGVRNRFVREMTVHADALPAYPIPLAAGRDLMAAARAAGRSDLVALWSGQGAALGRELPAAELVARLAAETDSTLARLTGSGRPA